MTIHSYSYPPDYNYDTEDWFVDFPADFAPDQVDVCLHNRGVWLRICDQAGHPHVVSLSPTTALELAASIQQQLAEMHRLFARIRQTQDVAPGDAL